MKAYVCDICGKQRPPNLYDGLPGGWYTIFRSKGTQEHVLKAYVCGDPCLVVFSERQGQAQAVEATHV